MNRESFFASVRSAPFTGSLTQPQVDGMTAILDEWDRRALTDLRWLAYMLATTFLETARTMQPIREFGRGKGMRYGTIYYGRGFVQLTWEANYRKASAVVAVDLVAHPDKALELPIAATIMFDGMMKGWFTGKKLADYIHWGDCDYVGARHIINGSDKATTIAGYAVSFEKALKAAAEPRPATHDQPPPTGLPIGPPPLKPPPAEDGLGEPETDEPPSNEAAFYIVVGVIGFGLLAVMLKLFNVF
jgi:putative chitinase